MGGNIKQPNVRYLPSIRQPRPYGFLGLPGLSGLPAPRGLFRESGEIELPYRPKGLLIESGSSVRAECATVVPLLVIETRSLDCQWMVAEYGLIGLPYTPIEFLGLVELRGP